jgi:hypothetical protein
MTAHTARRRTSGIVAKPSQLSLQLQNEARKTNFGDLPLSLGALGCGQHEPRNTWREDVMRSSRRKQLARKVDAMTICRLLNFFVA